MATSELNHRRILELEKCFSGRLVLADSGRVLIGEGMLMKVCRKKPKARLFLLFNDLLVYCSVVVTKKLYRSAHVFPLETMQVDANVEDVGDLRNGWKVLAPSKSFCVYAPTDYEKEQWVAHLERCISAARKTKPETNSAELSPVWIPDDHAPLCMCCRAAFSFVNRRHHCRKCGIVVCNTCSSNRAIIVSQSNVPVRVCNACFVKMPPSAARLAYEGAEANRKSDTSNLYDSIGYGVAGDNADAAIVAPDESSDDEDADGDNAHNTETLAGSEWYTYVASAAGAGHAVVDLGATDADDSAASGGLNAYSQVQKNKRVANAPPTHRQTMPAPVDATGIYAVASARPAEH